MCHCRHRAHDDQFLLSGLQDITAHVNFTAIAECGIDAGLGLIGCTTQAFFLVNCGIVTLLKDTSPENLREYLPESAQFQRLTSPAETGELFKVIAPGKSVLGPRKKAGLHSQNQGMPGRLCGFSRGDQTRMH